MPLTQLRIATRKSPLALWQANYIGAQIKSFWPRLHIKLVPMLTSGDKFLKDKLMTLGGKGLFVKELEEALLTNQADIAVHSMKDVPAFFPPGLMLSTITKRQSPFDAFISTQVKSLQQLPKGAYVGTSSLRRQSQLLALRPDLQIRPLRGNIHTRLSKLEEDNYAAIILAAAGLERMDMQSKITELLAPELMLPACGQGALGIECREIDDHIQQLLVPLNDPLSALCVQSERKVSQVLGGNCHVPLAVFCRSEKEGDLYLQAKILTLDGQTVIEEQVHGKSSDALSLAENCAEKLLAKGAKDLLMNCHE